MRKQLTIYEVVESKIADDNTCKGLILRNESVYKNKEAGYINFYVKNGSRIAKNATVYSIDENGEMYKQLLSMDGQYTISKEDNQELRNILKSFQREFSYSNYEKVVDLKNCIDKEMLNFSHVAASENMNSLLKGSKGSKGNPKFQVVKAKTSGIFSYNLDGYETVKIDDVTADMFQADYKVDTVPLDSAVDSNSSIFKIITSDNYSIVLNLSEIQYNKLVEKEKNARENNITPRVDIKFLKDNFSTSALYETVKRGDSYFAILSMSKYMQNYIDNRFVDIEIIFHAAEGLKIPKTALLDKEFFMIPSDFITTGGENNNTGLIKDVYSENGDLSYQFMDANVVADIDGFAYVETAGLKEGEYIRNAATQERFQIAKKGTLKGVYNVNKGYCIFKKVEILYENDEYCIVKTDTPNGLSNYDHILAESSSAMENEIIK